MAGLISCVVLIAGVGPCGVDDRGEQARIVQRLLRMPLHRKDEVVAGQLDGLDHTVGIPRADHQTGANFVDGLMVVARRVSGLPHQRGQPGARHRAHRQPGEHPVARTMSVVAKHVRQVLVQRAAERDIEDLRAPTDAQHRQPPGQRALQQRELPTIAGSAGLVGRRMRLLAVGDGVQVVAAGNHQGVQAVQNGMDDVGVHRLRRQQHRDTTGHRHALEVVRRQITRWDVPNPGLHLLQIGGQTYDRPSCPRGAQTHESSPNP